MKRFLSWAALLLCFVAVCVLSTLDSMLVNFLYGIFSRQSAIVKIIIVLFGGSFAIALAFVPAIYGAILSRKWSDSICQSKKGARYIVVGLCVAIVYMVSCVQIPNLRDMLIALFGVVLVILGAGRAKSGQ